MCGAAHGQDITTRNAAFWLDYDPTWPLNARWTIDVAASTRVFNSEPFLWEARLQPTLTFSPRKWMDLTGGVWFIYRGAAGVGDFFETRPYAGVRLKLDIWRGVRLSNYFRVEGRIIRDLNTGETMSRRRFRDRIEALIPINNRSLSEDNTWYALVSAELLLERSLIFEEGGASQQRYWAGVGWRKNSTWRFEFLYLLQRIRTSANAPFSISNDILNVRLIQNFK
ncbi:MAG: DUF2490 domain-containing protein [Blastocatellales bacterium]